ncbi:DUF7344 domain-containing protein [Halorubrum sp. HHNYT27]|uniref:DUF7344 domain-containing protein n=1 Tax=Halorubrum sp. HHNYT27 TaxID=3402275 RepID=UPI003EBAF581
MDGIGSTSRAGGSELTKGEIFDLLKNRRRRRVIRYLRANDGYAELNDLAEHIAAEENDIDVRQLSSDQRKRVYIGLYQCHLPKMDSLGVIDYNKDRGTIELQASVSQLLEYMDLDGEGTEQTTESIGTWKIPTVAAGVVAVVTIGSLGVGPLSAVPAATWTLVSVIGLLTIVGLQHGS